jgi:hypothetical protein
MTTERTPLYKNGEFVKDKISGLEGVVVAVTVWYNGCIRYAVQPRDVKDGKPVDAWSLDEEQLEGTGKYLNEVVSTRKGGGPKPPAARRADATRR